MRRRKHKNKFTMSSGKFARSRRSRAKFSMSSKRQRKQKVFSILAKAGAVTLAICVIGAGVWGARALWKDRAKEKLESLVSSEIKETDKQKKERQIQEAKHLAKAYDYDAAIVVLENVKDYEKDKTVQKLITDIKAEKDSCVPVNIDEVTHVFYHSLVVDPKRAFANQETDNQAVGNNQWMTTVSEFKKITQAMYDRGYVLVSLHDLYEETQDDSGNTVYKPATIMLPEGKKAFVLSVDDVSYYHAYDNYGYATKLVLDEDGNVMNEYTDAQGKTTIGAYDIVPILDQFVEKHPDASYRGAKGTVALTGYNGVLGYRTDATYDLNNPDCDIHQQAWIKAHPSFSLEDEIAQATKVADAMKENGWEFASHTWGHLRVGDSDLEKLKVDNEKWKDNIAPIVGKTDTIIFAHGQDLQSKGDYDMENEKYQYFREEGYRIFCNVDSNQYTTWFGKDYLRQGRRNIDGYRIYYNAIGEQDNLSDLFDAAEVIDPDRPPVYEI